MGDSEIFLPLSHIEEDRINNEVNKVIADILLDRMKDMETNLQKLQTDVDSLMQIFRVASEAVKTGSRLLRGFKWLASLAAAAMIFYTFYMTIKTGQAPKLEIPL